MARLNEAPIQTESVDALKRRFIRQNRDLARINTSQSLRIRSLELEQSRLQTENLCLREENSHLRQQLSDSFEKPQVTELNRIKRELERQLEVIGGVVAELGNVQETFVQEQKRIPDPSSWRPPVPNLRLAGQEMRMPPIVEDKTYPRRTLGADDVRAMRLSDHSTDSPDLGPPPIAQFDCSDPIKFDRAKLEQERILSDENDEPREIPAELAVNLETRRKRRESAVRRTNNEDDRSQEHGPSEAESQVDAPSRGSVKRKLCVREEDEPTRTASTETFNFTRKASIATGDDEVHESKVPATKSERYAEISSNSQPKERKVLGDSKQKCDRSVFKADMIPESTNTSPRKVVAAGNKPTRNHSKPTPTTLDKTDAVKVRARRPKVVSIPAPNMADDQISIIEPSTEPESIPPTTPAALDMFSPTPSEPSSLRKEHPHDAVTTANLEGMQRPSRRARAVTSYAEPSLNTKMRRPSVALVDAVYTNGKAGRTSIGGSVIKPETTDDEGESWKSLLAAAIEPSSPLGGKASVSDLRIPSPTGSRTVETVMRADRGSSEVLRERMRDLTVTDKSSRRTSSASSRRHSSVNLEALSSSPASPPKKEEVVEQPLADLLPEAKPVIKRTAARRRSMMV